MNGKKCHFQAPQIKKGGKAEGEVGVQKPRIPPWGTEYAIRIPKAALS